MRLPVYVFTRYVFTCLRVYALAFLYGAGSLDFLTRQLFLLVTGPSSLLFSLCTRSGWRPQDVDVVCRRWGPAFIYIGISGVSARIP